MEVTREARQAGGALGDWETAHTQGWRRAQSGG
jgi:hypothetical protein